MIPKKEYIKIHDNKRLIKELLEELVLEPRVKALDWSRLTKQTPNMKIGYPGQHLASLITGNQGARTGARGDDLEDGTEVKSCSRVDQLDSCNNCNKKVLRIEDICAHCGSKNIKRKDDSKWLFAIKSESELELLTKRIDRIFLTIADYPNFFENNFDTIRFQAFEIWNGCKRHKNFSTIMNNYFNKIFLEHIQLNPNKTPAPKNFWPYSYQFYLCNPVKVFEATVNKANTSPEINIDFLVPPEYDRELLLPEPMPTSLLNIEELRVLANKSSKSIIDPLLIGNGHAEIQDLIKGKSINKSRLINTMPYLDERSRLLLELRDTDKISSAKTPYKR